MRVLIIGRSRATSVESSIYRALVRAGHTAALVDDRKLDRWLGRRIGHAWLRARVRAFGPDRLLLFKPEDVSLDVLAQLCREVRASMWYRDLRIPPEPALVERARYAEVLFLTAGGQAPDWEARGARRACFLPNAADPALDRPTRALPELECDVAFIGRGYDETRAAFLCRLARRFRVRVFGQGWGAWARELNWGGGAVYGRDFARVCASAKIVLDIHPEFQVRTPVWGYHSARPARVLACGGFYLGHATPGSRELFADGGHCGWYDDEEDASVQIERYLGDDGARADIRAQGRAFVLAHHTFERRLRNLLAGEPWRNPLKPEMPSPAQP
ncbi:MAG: glycosyltransferase [Gemmatimonadetes bacterium]|nr:glycosyltransferase [Gemmatimonadota bacterium]